jgi:hypothetical protein
MIAKLFLLDRICANDVRETFVCRYANLRFDVAILPNRPIVGREDWWKEVLLVLCKMSKNTLFQYITVPKSTRKDTTH